MGLVLLTPGYKPLALTCQSPKHTHSHAHTQFYRGRMNKNDVFISFSVCLPDLCWQIDVFKCVYAQHM